METLILNSESYSKGEIEKLLHLTIPYTIDDINKSTERLIQQFNNMSNLGNDKQSELTKFINTIAFRIKTENNSQDMNNVIQTGNNFIIQTPDSIIGKTAKFEIFL